MGPLFRERSRILGDGLLEVPRHPLAGVLELVITCNIHTTTRWLKSQVPRAFSLSRQQSRPARPGRRLGSRLDGHRDGRPDAITVTRDSFRTRLLSPGTLFGRDYVNTGLFAAAIT